MILQTSSPQGPLLCSCPPSIEIGLMLRPSCTSKHHMCSLEETLKLKICSLAVDSLTSPAVQ